MTEWNSTKKHLEVLKKEKEEREKTEQATPQQTPQIPGQIPRWVLRTYSAKAIMLVFTLSTPFQIPQNLREEKYPEGQYTTRRLAEVMQSGGGIPEEEISKQRPGILDTGKEIRELKMCQGGRVLFEQLVKAGWQITDAHFEQRLSEEQKRKGKGQPDKFKVRLVLSRDPSAKKVTLDDLTMKELRRLMSQTFGFCHVWDNTRTINKNFVLSFGFLLKEQNAEVVPAIQ